MYSPIKDLIIGVDNFEDIVGVPVDKYIHYKAVIGDKSDNIDGIPGVGPKRAHRIVMEQGIHTQSKEHQELVERNFKLMSLEYSLEYNTDEKNYLESHHKQVLCDAKVDMKQFKNACKYYNMINIMKNMPEWKTLFDKPSTTVIDIVNNIDLLQGFDK